MEASSSGQGSRCLRALPSVRRSVHASGEKPYSMVGGLPMDAESREMLGIMDQLRSNDLDHTSATRVVFHKWR